MTLKSSSRISLKGSLQTTIRKTDAVGMDVMEGSAFAVIR